MKWGSNDIGKIYWGSSEIGKVYWGSSLVYGSGSGPTPPPLPSNYVTSGLVLWMDGIDKGPDDTAWVDKVSSKEFTNSGATFNDNNVEFNGTSDYLYNYNSYTPPASGSATIEVVFETTSTNSQAIFMPKSGGTRPAYFFNPTNGSIYMAGGSTAKRNLYTASFSTNTKYSSSVSNARAYLNGNALTASTTNYIAGAVNNYNYIGKRRVDSSTDPKNFFAGKIFSIRIYNRQLTADEVAANLAVDNARFSLGLTLS